MNALFGHRKPRDRYDEEMSEKAHEKQVEQSIKDTSRFLIPLLEQKFDEAKEKYPDVKEVIVTIKTFYNDTFEVTTVPETKKIVLPNKYPTGIRDMVFNAREIASEYNIEVLPFDSAFEGWTFPFKKTYP